jgi:hypothetical protein
MHDLDGMRVPDGKFAYRVDLPNGDQQQIVERLIDYYQRLNTKFVKQSHDDMWKTVSLGHSEFRIALEESDVETVSSMLLDICNTSLVPFERCMYRAYPYTATPEQECYLMMNVIDKYLALCEALGCMPVQDPEQGTWGYGYMNFDLYECIKKRLPFDITAPKAGGGCFGLVTEDGILSERNLQAIYSAFRVLNLLDDSKGIVCEIGGGIGTLAYYLVKAGIEEISMYDLPITSVVQGYYLAKSLGPDKVWFYGEPPRSAKVRIFSGWQFAEAPDNYFSIVVNQDSLPEIERDVAIDYLRLIAKKGNGYFLSINQEGQGYNLHGKQSIVFELMEQVEGFQRIRRIKDWMREGYVEETYRIIGEGI